MERIYVTLRPGDYDALLAISIKQREGKGVAPRGGRRPSASEGIRILLDKQNEKKR
jgi:hypothetical protein